MVKVRKLKKRMDLFNEVVAGLKEGKQEMSQQVRALEAAIDSLLLKIKVGGAVYTPFLSILCLIHQH